MSTASRPFHEQGALMLEVLITLTIMSVGLLGLAAIQAEGLKGGNDAISRSKAVVFVADLADRMRANLEGIDDYQLNLGENAAAAPDCSAIQCDPQQMALYDLSQWLQTLQGTSSGLPGAAGGVLQIDPANFPGLFSITVRWADRQQRQEVAATPEQYTTQVQF